MDRFVSNYTLRLDAKGRVSIPAPFRGVLVRDGFEGLYCYPTLDQAAIDAGGNALLSDIESLIARYPPYSNEREEFLVALYGTSETLKVDSEGRVVLSDELKTHASIKPQHNDHHPSAPSKFFPPEIRPPKSRIQLRCTIAHCSVKSAVL